MNDTRTADPRRFGDVEVETTDRVVVDLDQVGGGIVGVAFKRPVDVVVRTPLGEWRFRLTDES